MSDNYERPPDIYTFPVGLWRTMLEGNITPAHWRQYLEKKAQLPKSPDEQTLRFMNRAEERAKESLPSEVFAEQS